MKIVSAALVAVGLACACWSMPAQAQGLPQGTYLNSCTGAHLEGDALVARCRTMDGREQRSALAGVNRRGSHAMVVEAIGRARCKKRGLLDATHRLPDAELVSWRASAAG